VWSLRVPTIAELIRGCRLAVSRPDPEVNRRAALFVVECGVPSEHLVLYIGFDHRITDVVTDGTWDLDLVMPTAQHLGTDWRDIARIPPHHLTVLGQAIDKCISCGGVHQFDLGADLPSGHRKYGLTVQRNARQTHVVVIMTALDRRRSQRRVPNSRGGRRVSDIDFRQPFGPTHVSPSQIARAIGVDSKTILREIKAGELQAGRIHRDWKIPYAIARAYVLRMTATIP